MGMTRAMAGHSDSDNGSFEPGAMDISQHRKSYDEFMGWAKWGAMVSFIIAAVAVVIVAY